MSTKKACLLCRDAASSRRNPIQETDRFHSVGSGIAILFSVQKMKKSQWLFDNGIQRSGELNDIKTICYIRAITFWPNLNKKRNSDVTSAYFLYRLLKQAVKSFHLVVSCIDPAHFIFYSTTKNIYFPTKVIKVIVYYLIEYANDTQHLRDGLSLRRVRSKTGSVINTLR